MGNAQPGSGSSLPTYHSRSRQSSLSENPGIPVPQTHAPPMTNLEQELSNSLSSYSSMQSHKRASLSGSNDWMISPGQYRSRYRAGSVTIENEQDIAELLPTPIKQKLEAVLKWDQGGHKVSIAGSFNNWERKIPLVKSTNNFYQILSLEEGEHQYKFYVDGEPRLNPHEPTVTNLDGTVNNLVTVRKNDLEIFDALEKDSKSVRNRKDSCTEYPQEEYGQHVPSRKPATERNVGPPVIPQQLLKVLLNQDVAPHLEPGLLPEPNHVMINHLYALSIKDGVMVLSDTSRFRKKYVTTLLYKPID